MSALWSRLSQRVNSTKLSPVIGPIKAVPITITLVNYSEDELIEHTDVAAVECKAYLDKGPFTWIHIQGQPKPSDLREFGHLFQLHPLALEDVITASEQRAKTETYENQVMVILGMPRKKDFSITMEQVSIFLGENFLVSFHSGTEDPFRAVRRRLNHPKAPMRKRGIDYLLYVLVDVVIDSGFPVLDEFEKEIEHVEQELLGPAGEETIQTLYAIKRELLILRLKMRPQREAMRVLMRDDNDMLHEETKIYLRDCNDHIIRLIDVIEIYRDMTSNMLDVHLSLVNKKTFISNEIQRKVAIWTLIFAPLTYISGVYGMNFMFIPASKLAYGFELCIGFMFLLALLMVVYFKFKKWL